jgi:cytochrome c553
MSLPDRRTWRITIVLLAITSTISSAHADMLITEGMQPWETCAECHSLDGISAMPRFPKLAGQRADYIVKQVRDFREGRRQNDGGQMSAIAGEINDKDLAKSAVYFSDLPAPPPDTSLPTDSEEWKRGAALFSNGDEAAGIIKCGSCHDDADSRQTDAPLLKAQHAGYLAKQLRDWRSGERRNDVSKTMPTIAAKLTDRDIAALAAFLASQPRLQTNGKPAQ